MPSFTVALPFAMCLASLSAVAGLAWRIGRIGGRRDFAFLGALATILLAFLVCLASGARA
jgi:hypothetical protein